MKGIIRRHALPLLLGLALNLTWGPAVGEERPAVLTTEQVKARLSELDRRLRTWSIEYQATGAGLPYYTHRLIAARWPDTCFYHCSRGRCDFAWDSDRIGRGWTVDVLQDELLVKSNRAISWMPVNRQHKEIDLKPEEELPAKLQSELLFVALGWWPFEKRPAPEIKDVGSCAISAIVKSPRYAVRPSLESRQGRWCHILEHPGGDRLWLDCTKGCALVAREFIDPKTSAVMQCLECDEHVEVERGILVPRQIRNTIFDHNATSAQARQRPVAEAVIRLVAVKVNGQVEKTLFDLPKWPAGELQAFGDGTWKQTIGGGYEHMDELSEWIRHGRVRESHSDTADHAWHDYAAISLSGVVLLAIAWRGGVRRADRSGKQQPRGAQRHSRRNTVGAWHRRMIGRSLRQARALWRADDSARALRLLRVLAKADGSVPDVHIMLASVALEAGEFALAREALDTAALSCQESPYLSARVAGLQHQWGDLDGAWAILKIAQTKFPDSWVVWRAVGSLLFARGEFAQAATSFERQAELVPFERIRLEAMINVGNSLENNDRRAEASAVYRRVIDVAPHYARAYYRLVSCLSPQDNTVDLIAFLTTALASPLVEKLDKRHLHYALGRLYDRTGQYAEAFAQFTMANELRAIAVGQAYDLQEQQRAVEARIQLFKRDMIANLSRSGCPDDGLIFVVGMPRSGTTLVEQVLSSHSQVVGLGERPEIIYLTHLLPRILHTSREYPWCIEDMTSAAVASVSRGFLRHFKAVLTPSSKVVTKMPEDFWDIGLIASLFPNVKIVHCRRDPIDTCLSCYMQDFWGLPYATSLETLAEVYRLYVSIMKHWHSVLPPSVIMEVSYEELVRRPGDVIPKLCAFCGLDVEEGCCQPHQNRRGINTVSRWEVRRPIYNTSVRRWEHYREFLGPLLTLEELSTGGDAVDTGDNSLANPPHAVHPERERSAFA